MTQLVPPYLRERSASRLTSEEKSRLFNEIFAALKQEDRELKEARRKGGARPPRSACGLAYWVFETTLVYAAFKRLSRLGWDVEWEWPYGMDGTWKRPAEPGDASAYRKKADLVVFEGDSPKAIIEFKWWNSEHTKVHTAIRADIAKLRSWPSPAVDRLLVATWYSKDEDKRKDRTEVQQLTNGDGAAKLLSNGIKYFGTHCLERGKWKFAVAMVDVRALPSKRLVR